MNAKEAEVVRKFGETNQNKSMQMNNLADAAVILISDSCLIDRQLTESSVHSEQVIGGACSAWSQSLVSLGVFLIFEVLSVFLHLVPPLF